MEIRTVPHQNVFGALVFVLLCLFTLTVGLPVMVSGPKEFLLFGLFIAIHGWNFWPYFQETMVEGPRMDFTEERLAVRELGSSRTDRFRWSEVSRLEYQGGRYPRLRVVLARDPEGSPCYRVEGLDRDLESVVRVANDWLAGEKIGAPGSRVLTSGKKKGRDSGGGESAMTLAECLHAAV